MVVACFFFCLVEFFPPSRKVKVAFFLQFFFYFSRIYIETNDFIRYSNRWIEEQVNGQVM